MAWFWLSLYLICGLLAYGLTKNAFVTLHEEFNSSNESLERISKKLFLKFRGQEMRPSKLSRRRFVFTSEDELVCVMIALLGPFGLVIMTIAAFRVAKLGLCYRVPKELREPRQSSS